MGAGLKQMFHTGPGFAKKCVSIIITEILTGFFMALLVEVNLGTDPYAFLNVAVSDRLGISFGTWQMIFNLGLFLIVIGLREFSYIGIGTIANIFLLGYSCDFGRWFFHVILPAQAFKVFPARGVLFVIGLVTFIPCCGVYMNMHVGVSPFDAIPMIISSHLPKVPFAVVRMGWDFGMIGLGILFGGIPPVGCVIMAVCLGPIVGRIGKWMMKTFPALQ